MQMDYVLNKPDPAFLEGEIIQNILQLLNQSKKKRVLRTNNTKVFQNFWEVFLSAYPTNLIDTANTVFTYPCILCNSATYTWNFIKLNSAATLRFPTRIPRKLNIVADICAKSTDCRAVGSFVHICLPGVSRMLLWFGRF